MCFSVGGEETWNEKITGRKHCLSDLDKWFLSGFMLIHE